MLGKLLKHDFKSVGRYWWIIAIIMLGLFGTAGVSFGGFQSVIFLLEESAAENAVLTIAMVIGELALISSFALSLVGVGICSTAVSVLVYIRFFKHLFTDEGYLTFTLPVKRSQVFNAKVINAIIWFALDGIVCFFGCVFMIILMLLTSPLSKMGIDQEVLGSIVHFILDIPFTQWLWFGFWGIIISLITLAVSVLTPCSAYFCITLGSTVFKRAKVIGAIGTYLLMQILIQAFGQVFGNGIAFYLTLSGFGIVDIITKATDLGINALITALLLTVLGIVATLAALFYSATRNIIERKLNLA